MSLSAFLAAGAAIASTVGKLASSSAAQRQQAQAQAEQNAIARANLDAQLATQVDAYGNQIVYDPKTGWRTILSAGQQQLADASQAEQLKRLTTDAGMRRDSMTANQARRQEEGQLANSLLAQYRYNQQNPRNFVEEARRQLQSQSNSETNDAFREVARATSMNAMRSGTSATDAVTSKLGNAWAKANQQSSNVNPQDLGALSQLLAGSRPGANLQDYNTLASRASAFDDTAFQGYDPNAQLASVLANKQGQSNNASRTATAAAGSVPQTQSNPFGALGGLLNSFRGTSDELGKAYDIPWLQIASGTQKDNAAPTFSSPTFNGSLY